MKNKIAQRTDLTSSQLKEDFKVEEKNRKNSSTVNYYLYIMCTNTIMITEKRDHRKMVEIKKKNVKSMYSKCLKFGCLKSELFCVSRQKGCLKFHTKVYGFLALHKSV